MIMNKRALSFIVVLCLVLVISFVSAGLFSDFFKITGKTTNQPTNVTVGVVGASQVTVGPVDNSSLAGGVSPVEFGSTSVTIYGTICDPDGVSDINDSATDVQFVKDSITKDGSCSHVGDIDSNCANYSCSVNMYYWDAPGNWIINFSGSDIGNQTTIYNDTYTFQYNELKAMIISPNALTWNTLSSGSSNQKSSNHPTIINNTGNYNGTLKVTGFNLLGEIDNSQSIPANNFTVDPADGSVCSSGTALSNNTLIDILGSQLSRGNLTAGFGKEELSYCIPSVPLVSSQIYSTSQGGSWIISI